MSLSHGRNLSFWISTPSGGASASYSTSTKEVNGLPGEQDLGDVSVAGNVGHTSYPGLQKASFTSVHVFDSSSTGTPIWTTVGPFQTLQQTYPTAPWGIQFGPKGTTSGYPELVCNAWIKSISMPVKVTDPNEFTINWEMTAGSTGLTVGVWT
jgi:hypothetical protein